MRAAAYGFESGFTGLIGLTITSMVWWDGYYKMILSLLSNPIEPNVGCTNMR